MKKIIIFIAIIAATIILVIVFITKKSTIPPATDPFGEPPKGAAFNCGPEDRYKHDVAISSKEDFLKFLKTQQLSGFIQLDNYKQNNEVAWEVVESSIVTSRVGGRIIYSISYTPMSCSPEQKFEFKMTNDGNLSIYGCCGK